MIHGLNRRNELRNSQLYGVSNFQYPSSEIWSAVSAYNKLSDSNLKRGIYSRKLLKNEKAQTIAILQTYLSLWSVFLNTYLKIIIWSAVFLYVLYRQQMAWYVDYIGRITAIYVSNALLTLSTWQRLYIENSQHICKQYRPGSEGSNRRSRALWSGLYCLKM